MKNITNIDDTYIQKISEHHLLLHADPLTMKIICDATTKFLDDNSIDDTTLRDFLYTMSNRYQEFFKLDQDFWDFTNDHKELLGIK